MKRVGAYIKCNTSSVVMGLSPCCRQPAVWLIKQAQHLFSLSREVHEFPSASCWFECCHSSLFRIGLFQEVIMWKLICVLWTDANINVFHCFHDNFHMVTTWLFIVLMTIVTVYTSWLQSIRFAKWWEVGNGDDSRCKAKQWWRSWWMTVTGKLRSCSRLNQDVKCNATTMDKTSDLLQSVQESCCAMPVSGINIVSYSTCATRLCNLV